MVRCRSTLPRHCRLTSPALRQSPCHRNTLQWRHNGYDGVSNHQHINCLPIRLFRRRSKKTSTLRVTGLCEGNSPVTGEFPSQRASNAENVPIWWRHDEPMVYINHHMNHDNYQYDRNTKKWIIPCAYVMRDTSYSISQEICTRFLLCCALLWLYIDWFSHIHQAYFTGTVAI